MALILKKVTRKEMEELSEQHSQLKTKSKIMKEDDVFFLESTRERR